MAGDWIKMRGNLWDDPRVAAMCDACDCGEAQIVGALYWLWSTADQHSEDGYMPGLTLRQIDRKTGVSGFGASLCEIGWLRDDPQGVVIVKFEEHNGESAKKRCQTAKRVAKHKSANAEVTHKALPNEQNCVSGALPREREEKSNTPKPPRGGKAAVSIKTWADETRAAGEKLIPDDDPVFVYATEVGIPDDFMALAWAEFKHRYAQAGAKRYKDWRAVFRKAVRGNWLKLWYLDGDAYRLTTVGHQAARTKDAA